MIWSWTVDAAFDGERADRGLFKAFESAQGAWLQDSGDEPEDFTAPSRSQLQRWIDDGRVEAAGRKLKSSTRLATGMEIRVDLPEPRSLQLVPEDRPLEVLFEDSHLLVVNKPPALTVHSSATQPEGTLVHALLFHIRDLSGIGGVLRPGIVHRIDKDTSGALVVSKTDACHAGLTRIFAEHAIERRYWALCYGAPSWSTHTVEGLIGRSPTDRKKMALDVRNGKPSMTHLKVLERYNGAASWIEATLETGRTHQVRVHLTSLGHSLLGDPVYGTPTDRQHKWIQLSHEAKAAVRKLPGQALHARVLGFRHPITGESLRFEAPLPEAFRETLAALRGTSEALPR